MGYFIKILSLGLRLPHLLFTALVLKKIFFFYLWVDTQALLCPAKALRVECNLWAQTSPLTSLRIEEYRVAAGEGRDLQIFGALELVATQKAGFI